LTPRRGITGAYVTELLGRKEMVVVHVLADAPAGGVLRADDAIIGANGRLFVDPEDPRPEMGHALVESQSPELRGALTLHVVRDRKPMNLEIDLGSTLSYSDTWPFDCEKTRRVRQAALDFVISSHPWHRYNFWTPLFLMASGDDAALELARRHLCASLKDQYEENTGASAWTGGYRLINLCEYYLLTGDSSVLPAIQHQAEGVAWAQYRSGSWSHGAGKGRNVVAPGTALELPVRVGHALQPRRPHGQRHEQHGRRRLPLVGGRRDGRPLGADRLLHVDGARTRPCGRHLQRRLGSGGCGAGAAGGVPRLHEPDAVGLRDGAGP
jgi:hypothetical protein